MYPRMDMYIIYRYCPICLHLLSCSFLFVFFSFLSFLFCLAPCFCSCLFILLARWRCHKDLNVCVCLEGWLKQRFKPRRSLCALDMQQVELPTAEELAMGMLVFQALLNVPSLQERCHRLSGDPKLTDRDILQLPRFPKIYADDVQKKRDIVSTLISLDVDQCLASVPVTAHVFYRLDKHFEFKLSGHEPLGLRGRYQRWEADKLRLLWSHFKRLLHRSESSDNLMLWHLKDQYVQRENSKVASASSLAPPALQLPVA